MASWWFVALSQARTIEWNVDLFGASVTASKQSEIRIHCANGKRVTLMTEKQKLLKKWTTALTTSSCAVRKRERKDYNEAGLSFGPRAH